MDTRYQEMLAALERDHQRKEYRLIIEAVAEWIFRGRPAQPEFSS